MRLYITELSVSNAVTSLKANIGTTMLRVPAEHAQLTAGIIIFGEAGKKATGWKLMKYRR